MLSSRWFPIHSGCRLGKFWAGVLLFLITPFAFAEEIRPKPLNLSNPRRTAVVEAVEKVKAAVVNIHSERTVSSTRDKGANLAQNQQRVNGMGSGVIIDPRGLIVTNYHVVDEVQSLRVKLHDGSSFPARVVARDPEVDLAVIKIDPTKTLPVMPYGTANDLMVGEPVIAIGNAFGYEHTVTTGIVSALKRDVNLNKEISYKSLIQIDASINPGNSGGPLLNIHGELIGINVAIRAGAQGIAFAIPVDSVLQTSADMLSLRRRTGLNHGLVLRDEVDVSDNPVRRMAIVERCEANSPAARAGLQPGDMIEKLGDAPIRTSLDWERALLDKNATDKIAVTARRRNKGSSAGVEVVGEFQIKPPEKVAVAPAVPPAEVVWKKFGIKAQPTPAETVNKVNEQLHGGLSITEVNPGSIAAKSGFQRGDILIGLHQWETLSLENVAFVMNHPDLATFSPVRFFRIRNAQLQRGWLVQE